MNINKVTQEERLNWLLFYNTPVICLVLDEEKKVYLLNQMAEKVLKTSTVEAALHKPGNILHCLHALYGGKECGLNDECFNCSANLAFQDALNTNQVVRRRGNLLVESLGEMKYIKAFVCAVPVFFDNKKYIIITIEDLLSSSTKSSDMVSICANCKKLLDEDKWKLIEEYFEDNFEKEMTHTVCPECIKELYPQLAEKILKEISQGK